MASEAQPYGASTMPSDAIRVASVAELEARGVVTVSAAGARIAVFQDGEHIRAVDNRCPHMGFPLDEGTVKDGILTCHWHQARFDLASGCTFDLFADDVPSYETWTRDGDVFVAAQPARLLDLAYHAHRLHTGVELNVPLVQAKSLLGLLDLDAELESIVSDIAVYASKNLVSFSEGLVRLACVANLYPLLGRETAYQALLYAIRQVADDTAFSVARREREPLATDDHTPETLKRWLRQWVQTRHRDGAERTLLTGIERGEPALVADLLYGAASERLYATTGHVLDACNKALELVDLLGPDAARQLVPLLVPALTQTRGEEESTTWHHPIEIVDPIRDVERRLPRILEAAADATKAPPWSGREALTEVLLGDDPLAIIRALEDALVARASAEELARRVAHAASMRLARFATSNEVTDWFSPQHTLNFANAVHQAVCRVVAPDTVRAIFQAAIAVYVDRYLNVPAARLPGERGSLDDLPEEIEALRGALLERLDQRAEIDACARIVSRWVRLGHDIDRLIDVLVYAAVREDIDFHSLQVIEASARQCAAWGEGPEIEHILVGAVRNLAAHCPTRRAGQQTANIALRLHRGDRVFEDTEPPVAE
jgi:nitrite reductase/ring-hydroxylating ferredoxin subunit